MTRLSVSIPIRRVTLLGSIAFVSSLVGCNLDELIEPCYAGGQSPSDVPYNGVAGSWHLVTVDNKPLPYTIPFSGLTPLGVIVAKSGDLRFGVSQRGFADDCRSLRGEKGTAYATYSYTQRGAAVPEGSFAGGFNADYDANEILLTAGDSSRTAHVTGWDAAGRPDEITAITPIKKWSLELTFVLVFRRGSSN